MTLAQALFLSPLTVVLNHDAVSWMAYSESTMILAQVKIPGHEACLFVSDGRTAAIPTWALRKDGWAGKTEAYVQGGLYPEFAVGEALAEATRAVRGSVLEMALLEQQLGGAMENFRSRVEHAVLTISKDATEALTSAFVEAVEELEAAASQW